MSYFGIRGFESILRGGIPQRAALLLLAPEGTARALLGAHWVVEGLQRGERVLVVLAGEAPDAFTARLGRMGIDTAKAVATGNLVIVDWHTAWTQTVEGVVEVARTVRASRKIEDLLAAVDRALPVLLPAAQRRAFLDVLPLALKGYEEAQALDLVKALRARFSESQVTCVFAAGRGMSEATIATIAKEWHAVLDAKPMEKDAFGLAVLTVGGVPLTPRYRRTRIREDGAAVEAEPAARTFSCPICDARVPFDAEKCPSCGTARADMTTRAKPGVLAYLEKLGLEATPERDRAPAKEPRPAGRTNGSRPAPTNGLGRVNGLAPRGRTNGLVKGRTNGIAPPAGRTNGLVNGVRRARAGMTNGLTNGSGFTNGLGGGRARSESRRSRWKVYLVPLIAAILLVAPFLVPEPEGAPATSIDGAFGEWQGVAGYAQTADADVPADIAITAYKVVRDGADLDLYVAVAGTWFRDPNDTHMLYAFLDLDRDATTGYDVEGLGADRLATVEGSGRVVTMTSLRAFEGSDPSNWTAWTSTGSLSAAVADSELELAIPWDLEDGEPTILLVAEDGEANRSLSVAFRLELGALRATVTPASAILARGTPAAAVVDLEAFGAPVNITAMDIRITGGATLVPPTFPLRVLPGAPESLILRIDTSDVPDGTLVTSEVRGVTADRPVLIPAGVAQSYVGSAPEGKRIDGWFGDWTAPELSNDTDSGRPSPHRDIQRFAANRTADVLYTYMDVRGRLFAGTPAPVTRVKPTDGGSQSSPPGVPMHVAGEDVVRIFVDVDRNQDAGLAILNLRGADLLIEIRGMYGRITAREAFAWSGRWTPTADPSAALDPHRIEASVPVSGAVAIDVAFQASSWRGVDDVTAPIGSRGVRSAGAGALRFDGRFAAVFRPEGRVELSSQGVGIAWALPSANPSEPWSLAATPVGVRYAARAVEVRYTVSDLLVKEEIIFSAPPPSGSLAFPFELSGRATAEVGSGGRIRIHDGDATMFEIAEPFAIDSMGSVTHLEMSLDLQAGLLRISLPQELLDAASYPLVVDPVVSYTLEDDGPSSDAGEHLGWSTAFGDFNGDGYADLLTGAPDNNIGGNNHGYAYVYYGPFNANDSTPDVRINGTTNSAQFGYSVAAGKFNNDQFWDALVARKSAQALGVFGNVSIYYGSSSWSGLETTPDVNFTWPGSPQNFGFAVAAGDVDNANYDDVLIGEPGRDDDGGLQTQDGAIHVYKSPFGAVESSADYILLPSTNASGQMGQSIAVGKIDSDAYADVVAGEPVFSSNAGRVHFYKGIGLVSGSGNRYPNATISNPSGGGSLHQFGRSVAVGLVNGDAYADVAVGAPRKFSEDGRMYLFLANSGGSGLTTGASPSATLVSVSTAENFGTSVAIVDWDDDGSGGILVGAPLADVGGTNRGRVYWFDDPDTDQTADITITGEVNEERMGQSVAGAKFSSDASTTAAWGAFGWNDGSELGQGRVIVASVPEPLAMLLFVVVVTVPLVRRTRSRRRRYH